MFITITKGDLDGSIQKRMEVSHDLGAIYRREHRHVHGYFFQDRWIEKEWIVPFDKINEFLEIWYTKKYENYPKVKSSKEK